MITIFHGDNSANSRAKLHEFLQQEKGKGNEIRYIEGDKLAPKDLDSILSTSNLFFSEVLVIENLLTRLRSKDKDTCLTLLKKYSGDKQIYLWDKKSVTKLTINKLGSNTKVIESKTPTVLFTLLETLEPGRSKEALSLFSEVVESTEDIVVFTMIARQLSYLIMMKSASNPKFSPWQAAKLKIQSSKWSNSQLQDFMSQLLKIDLSIKSGTSKLSYKDQLDILLLNLLG